MGIAMAFRKVSTDELNSLRHSKGAEWQSFEENNASESIDVDKAWDGIHYLLTGRSSAPKPTHIGAIFGDVMRSLMGAEASPAQQGVGPDWVNESDAKVLEWLIAKGEDIHVDVHGSERPTYIPAERVKQIAPLLNALSDDELGRRFDPEKMAAAGVYLEKFWSRDREQGWQYLIANYRVLKTFVVSAAAENKAIIRYLC